MEKDDDLEEQIQLSLHILNRLVKPLVENTIVFKRLGTQQS